MSKLKVAGVSLLMSGGLVIGGNYLSDSIVEDFDNGNPAITKCAETLGEVAIESTKLPHECLNNSYTKDLFSYTEVTTDSVSDTGERKQISQKLTFVLPTKKEFLKKNIVTKEDIDSNKNSNRKFLIGMGVFSSILFYGMFRPHKPGSSYSLIVGENQQ